MDQCIDLLCVDPDADVVLGVDVAVRDRLVGPDLQKKEGIDEKGKEQPRLDGNRDTNLNGRNPEPQALGVQLRHPAPNELQHLPQGGAVASGIKPLLPALPASHTPLTRKRSGAIFLDSDEDEMPAPKKRRFGAREPPRRVQNARVVNLDPNSDEEDHWLRGRAPTAPVFRVEDVMVKRATLPPVVSRSVNTTAPSVAGAASGAGPASIDGTRAAQRIDNPIHIELQVQREPSRSPDPIALSLASMTGMFPDAHPTYLASVLSRLNDDCEAATDEVLQKKGKYPKRGDDFLEAGGAESNKTSEDLSVVADKDFDNADPTFKPSKAYKRDR
ncbi:hypothetical protein M427DRAFT_27796 [Gonapodya prolifera JEL478]|uniref:Uncharacterized protein n=1 Tax=Gonapodya prolifera (strain JEL478) TaxID=1344416 RepID=A0A139AXE5_GONPJ|nr:hypothetical protein M427DRAFT_27796 [Gonapodya prolifera JEL478]|eukprot:KXS21421.1 hypothetical protein M427DRAFT_27796 [Gonapodya prolifera JEL478]